MRIMRHIAHLAFAAPLLAGCVIERIHENDQIHGTGTLTTQTRPVPEFDAIEVTDGLVAVVASGPHAVSVTIDENLQPLVETIVENRALKVRFRRNVSVTVSPGSLIEIASPLVTQLGATGGATMRATAPFANALDAVAADGGQLDLDGTAATLRARVTGGASLEARNLDAGLAEVEVLDGGFATLLGTTGALDANLLGGSTLNARDLTASAATIEAADGAYVEIWTTESVTARLSGGSSLVVRGRPGVRHVTTSDGSTVDFE